MFHVLTRDELVLRLPDEAEIEDLESGATLITRPAETRTSYERRIKEFLDMWRRRCAGYGIDYTLALTDVPLDQVLKDYLLRRVRFGRPMTLHWLNPLALAGLAAAALRVIIHLLKRHRAPRGRFRRCVF